MAHLCSRCTRANPADAIYCYFDGTALEGRTVARPTPAAGKTFPSPFVFPSGRACTTYDALARGCLEEWEVARDLLRQGFLANFLGGLGRADLTQAARAAAAYPDPDRGLDQFLARLPATGVQAPRLHVSPAAVDLGQLAAGADAPFELRLGNRGQRLLYGAVVADCDWLVLGDGAGSAQKLFQTRDEVVIPVHVRGQHLRASTKPLEGRLTIESSGGAHTVLVKARVPVTPFPAGALAGATTPRAIAVKAKHSPREAALLFEQGAVQRWYKDNGWTYPVQGECASGVAAVQQFFEALGLVKPPKVEISEQALSLRVATGARVRHALQVRSPERRPVFAQARSDQPWLTVGPVRHSGPVAVIPLELTAAAPPGKTLQGRVHVTSNGNQHFAVAVMLAVGAAAPPLRPAPPRGRPVLPASRPLWAHLAPLAVLLLLLLGLCGRDALTDAPLSVQMALHDEPAVEEKKGPPPLMVQVQDEPEEQAPGPKVAPVLFQVVDEPEVREPVNVPVQVEIKDEPQEGGGAAAGLAPVDPTPRLAFRYGGGGRFGVTAAQTGKRLTYSPNGATNLTIVAVDGRLIRMGAGAAERPGRPPDDVGRTAQCYVWPVGRVEFTQDYELVPSKQPVEVAPGVQKRLVDTLLLRYTISNRDTRAHRVGLRTTVDTLIGGNDGVPFAVPGLPGLVDTCRDFPTSRSVPDFIQALEFPNLQNPGTVAHMTLKLGGRLEPPGRVSLTCWRNALNPSVWNVPVVPIAGDSAVVLYWNAKALAAGQTRRFGFAYGLGSVSAGEATGRLGVTLGGSFDPGQVFTVTAYATNPVPGQTLTLELPAGLERVEGDQTQPARAGAGATAIVTWKAKVLQTGVFRLRVRSSTGVTQTKTITIARPEGGNFTLRLAGAFEPGKDFQVAAQVMKPLPGQTLALRLPAGLTRVGGQEVEPVPAAAADGTSTVAWTVRVNAAGRHPVRVQSSTGLTQAKTVVIAQGDPNAGRFTVALGGEIAPGKVFSVSARVPAPLPEQTLTLGLDAGLERVGGRETEPVHAAAPGAAGTVSWRVKVGQPGKHTVAVRSSTGVTLKKTLTIERPDEGAGNFTVAFRGDFGLGKDFLVQAEVTSPVRGQKLTLTLPKGLRREAGAPVQAVPAATGRISTVTWRVRVLELGRLPVRVASTTGVVRTKVLTLSAADDPRQIFGR